jgi:hypothetical protein
MRAAFIAAMTSALSQKFEELFRLVFASCFVAPPRQSYGYASSARLA